MAQVSRKLIYISCLPQCVFRCVHNAYVLRELGRDAVERQGLSQSRPSSKRADDPPAGEESVSLSKEDMVRLIPKLRAFATSLCGNPDEADDLVQETLLRAWKFRDTFQPDTNLRAWMFKILRNEFLTQVKKQRPIGDADGRYGRRLTTLPDQEWRLAYSEVLDALKRLSADTRAALVLVGGAGLSYEEAADCCGCAVGTIKSRVSRARSQLARLTDHEERWEAFEPPTIAAP